MRYPQSSGRETPRSGPHSVTGSLSDGKAPARFTRRFVLSFTLLASVLVGSCESMLTCDLLDPHYERREDFSGFDTFFPLGVGNTWVYSGSVTKAGQSFPLWNAVVILDSQRIVLGDVYTTVDHFRADTSRDDTIRYLIEDHVLTRVTRVDSTGRIERDEPQLPEAILNKADSGFVYFWPDPDGLFVDEYCRYEVMATDLTVMVNGTIYDQCIRVKTKFRYDHNPDGRSIFDIDATYAPWVGRIKQEKRVYRNGVLEAVLVDSLVSSSIHCDLCD